MKRPLEEDEAPSREEPDDEARILQDLHDNLLKGNRNETIEKRLFETQKDYFKMYMEKLMQKIPMGEELVKIVQGRAGTDEFEYTFTAAKSVIQSQMRVKQIRALHSVFDMVYGLMGRYVHEKVVSPALKHVLADEQLKAAYERYQSCSHAEEEGSVVEMQCLLYCIQEVLENQEPVKIPNPLYSRFTQQMKAASEYVVTILVSLSRPRAASEEDPTREGDPAVPTSEFPIGDFPTRETDWTVPTRETDRTVPTREVPTRETDWTVPTRETDRTVPTREVPTREFSILEFRARETEEDARPTTEPLPTKESSAKGVEIKRKGPKMKKRVRDTEEKLLWNETMEGERLTEV